MGFALIANGYNTGQNTVSEGQGIFYSDLELNPETSSEFTGGVSGSTYGFISVAHDNVGHVEAMPVEADSETLVIIGAWTNDQDNFDVDHSGCLSRILSKSCSYNTS